MGASPHSVWDGLYMCVIQGGEELWGKIWRLAITNCINILKTFSTPSKHPHISLYPPQKTQRESVLGSSPSCLHIHSLIPSQ